MKVNNAQLINQDSGNFEWYTPSNIVELARKTMGEIDLDPASSEAANLRVKANRYFSDGALEKVWFGRVWMNHPYSKTNNPLFIRKLIAEYQSGRVLEACCIVYTATSERWFRPLLNFPICFIHGRTRFLLPNGDTKGGQPKELALFTSAKTLIVFAKTSRR